MASGGWGYWSIDSLQDFCESIIESFGDGERLDKYKEKWSWHQKHNVPGGICDMSTLWLYLKEERKRIVNLCKAEEKLVFDCAIASSDNYSENEYMMTDEIKKADCIGGNPYFQKRQEI